MRSLTRHEPARVVVFGGGGFYGRFLVADLLEFTHCQVLVAERHPPHGWSGTTRIQTEVCDVRDRVTVRRLVAESDLVIHCAGPFQMLPLIPAQAAVEYGKPYIDLSEDRVFRRHILAFDDQARQSGATLATGASVVPGMQVLLATLLQPGLDRIDAIRTFAAPDLKRHRGPAMFYTMLLGAGSSFRLPRNGKQVQAYGWTEPEWVHFPPPVGNRLVYLVLEMAELDLLPERFAAQTVEFKAGCEFSVLSRMFSALARLRVATGHPQLEHWLVPVRAFCWTIGRVGREEGGFIIEVSGPRGGEYHANALSVVAGSNGGRIPSMLGGILAEDILEGRLTQRGVVSPEEWMTPERLIDGFAQRSLVLWHRTDQEEWQPLSSTPRHDLFLT